METCCLKDTDWPAGLAEVFLNAFMQAPIIRPCMTYFWLWPAIVLFLLPVGQAVVDPYANELALPAANFAEGGKEKRRDRDTCQGRE